MENHAPPPPVFTPPPPDPTLQALNQQSEAQNIAAIKTQSAQDTAHLMQQYGIVSALTGASTPMFSMGGTQAAPAASSAFPSINQFKSA